MTTTLREKLPELMIEAAMVVLAVLAALGVEEWREGRQQVELAERALAVVVAEIEANRQELEDNRPANRALLDEVVAADRAGRIPEDFDLTFEYSLISASGWETAQVTRATHFMPLDQVQSLAKLYGLQALYQESQDRVLEFILDIGPVAREDPDRIPSLVRGSLTTSVGMQEVLVEAYDSLLADLPRAQAASGAR